jgi:LDH2 family malate/lactate/ureidoglycolate dehydrogenase
MTLGRLRLSVADARDLAEGALRSIGYHNDEARIIADHVIDAAMCGYEYSGLARILNVDVHEVHTNGRVAHARTTHPRAFRGSASLAAEHNSRQLSSLMR